MKTFVCTACSETLPEEERTGSDHDTGNERNICLHCHCEIITPDSDLACSGCDNPRGLRPPTKKEK